MFSQSFIKSQKEGMERALKNLNAASRHWSKTEAPKINRAIERLRNLKNSTNRC